MTATREQLVADWHDRLAAAQADPLALSGQGAWLARVKIRLYRLLISIYGDGQWSRGETLRKDNAGHDGAAAELSQSGPLLGTGKPARTAGKIAAVLKAVANAQDAPRTCGPLAGGITADSWIVVACESANISPTRCAMLLESSGIVTRIANQGDDVLVHVPAADRKQALMLIDKHADTVRRRARHPEARRWRGAQWMVLGLLCAPFVGLVAQAGLVSYSQAAPDQRMLAWAFFVGCAASIVAGSALQGLAQTPLLRDWKARAFDRKPKSSGSRSTSPVVLWIGCVPLFAVLAYFAALVWIACLPSAGPTHGPLLAAMATFGLLSLLPLWPLVSKDIRATWQAAALRFARLRDGLRTSDALPERDPPAQEKSRCSQAPAKTSSAVERA
jgi:hypothetical protein